MHVVPRRRLTEQSQREEEEEEKEKALRALAHGTRRTLPSPTPSLSFCTTEPSRILLRPLAVVGVSWMGAVAPRYHVSSQCLNRLRDGRGHFPISNDRSQNQVL